MSSWLNLVFKAIDTRSGETVVSIDDRWSNAIAQLRDLGRSNALVCQHCQQPVRLRVPADRRRHFAHKDLQDCPYATEPPELLAARAHLYRWLQDKHRGRDSEVSIEHRLDDDLPHPVDCIVTTKTSTAMYWIIQGAFSSARREIVQDAFRRHEVSPNWLFLASMLRVAGHDENRLLLTTTEREFLKPTSFDRIADLYWGGASLHYLDHDGLLITYRGLHLVHGPQVYLGQRVSHPLPEVLWRPSTGEFVHPGEQLAPQRPSAKPKPQDPDDDSEDLLDEDDLDDLLDDQQYRRLRQGQPSRAPERVESDYRERVAQIEADKLIRITCERCGAVVPLDDCPVYRRSTLLGICRTCMQNPR